ncbi:hypothetical protein CIC12_05845 [Burkholderia sp. SG-MS1]|uniref:hypothetical protein n=1 Tax=Paraburkholderia sp. SG-MS1 TaxID=2023741 RepID=UPI0014462D77|nr:hypothetical protein [Paraburkholderia sp. SG-MS1]NKJ46273.1 hypothetical protein [Paraburkholderia sp. SG-MS1]
MAKRIRIDKSVALKSFHGVIPMETIAGINEIIDRSFDNVPLRSHSGAVVAELIRRGEEFQEPEQTLCVNARAMTAICQVTRKLERAPSSWFDDDSSDR